MKILAVGHSLQADRQQRFYQYIESLGHEVKLLIPDWGTRVRGFLDHVRDFKPEIIFCQDETDGSVYQAIHTKRELGIRVGLLHWENLTHMKRLGKGTLGKFDLHIAGCPGALRLLERLGVEHVHPHPVPQVGLDMENLFKPNPQPKEFDTCTSARFSVDKGADLTEQTVRELKLKHLWLGWRRRFDILPYEGFPTYGYWPGKQPYERLPPWYNRARVHVLASRDTPQWQEQFTYAIPESLACGLYQIITDAGEWPELWEKAPGVIMVPQGFKSLLSDAIVSALEREGRNLEGSEWVRKNYSMEAVARGLLRALS